MKKPQLFSIIAVGMTVAAIITMFLVSETQIVNEFRSNVELGDEGEKDYYVLGVRTEKFDYIILEVQLQNASSTVNIEAWIILDNYYGQGQESSAISHVQSGAGSDPIVLGPSNGWGVSDFSISMMEMSTKRDDYTVVIYGANNTCDIMITTLEYFQVTVIEGYIWVLILCILSIVFVSVSVMMNRKED